jgi:hypothetical protein
MGKTMANMTGGQIRYTASGDPAFGSSAQPWTNEAGERQRFDKMPG